jgi:hypothetical protein
MVKHSVPRRNRRPWLLGSCPLLADRGAAHARGRQGDCERVADRETWQAQREDSGDAEGRSAAASKRGGNSSGARETAVTDRANVAFSSVVLDGTLIGAQRWMLTVDSHAVSPCSV